MINESLNLEIWERLIQGKPFDGLPLGSNDGRIILHGLRLPEPAVSRQFQFRDAQFSKVDAGVIQSPKWRDLDFSGSKLAGLRLALGQVENCRFDNCDLQGARFWATVFRGVSFKSANLRGAVLGGVVDDVRNTFVEIDFHATNLSSTTYQAAAFERCSFRNAKLSKIDFQSSTFKDCSFEGDLTDVMFYRHGFEGQKFPPNEMLNVDFSRAKLHDVGFRGLTLDRVTLPTGPDHIVFKDVPATLDKLFAALEKQGDPTAKLLVAFLSIDREWVAPNQAQAVISVQDLEEVAGVEGAVRLRELVRQC
jgi:uncharacterized protein YjbI with pentapeptide repeats